MRVGISQGVLQSSRILYSDQFAHDVRLTEQEIGIIVHGLYVLSTAFDMESDYFALVDKVRSRLNEILDEPAIKL